MTLTTVDSTVWSYFGWRDLTIFNKNSNKDKSANHIPPYVIEPIVNIPMSARLGVLGMTRSISIFWTTRYMQPAGKRDYCCQRGAAGAVGSIAGDQIGKILKCRVIGLAGGVEKCHWLTEDLHFDIAIDYKNENIEEALKLATPNGIDIYLDNVGGDISSMVLSKMNEFGRVAVCGSIST